MPRVLGPASNVISEVGIDHNINQDWSTFGFGGQTPPMPSSEEGSEPVTPDIVNGSTTVPDVDLSNVDTDVSDAVTSYSPGMSLSNLMKENPGLDFEQYMKIMAEHSDEWAEKLLDYYAEKASIDEQNRYTASREDTAYQRLVQDLKAAGLNPAMMYGSTASPSASGSVGHLNLSEGSTSRGISNYSKIKQLLLGMVALEWQIQHETTNDVFKGLDTIIKAFVPLLGLFG